MERTFLWTHDLCVTYLVSKVNYQSHANLMFKTSVQVNRTFEAWFIEDEVIHVDKSQLSMR